MKIVRFLGFSAAFLLAIASLQACGSNPDTVIIRLRTGLESLGNATNLMKVFSVPTYSIAGYCLQRNLYAANDAGVNGGDALEIQRIDIKTAYATAAYSITATDLANASYASFPPVSIAIPRGVEVGVGILGSLANSQTLDSDGVHCPDFNAGGVPYSTTSVIGHKRVVATQSMDVGVKLWVTPTTVNPSPTPSPFPNGSPNQDLNCANEPDENQNCPTVDFANIACAACASATVSLRVEYAFDRRDQNQRVIQWIPSNIASNANVPSVFPIRVFAVDSSRNQLDVRDVSDQQFPNDGGSINLSMAGAGTVTIIKRPRKQIPVIQSFTINTITTGTVSGASVTWTAASNATQYQIQVLSGASVIDVGTVNGNSFIIPNSALSPFAGTTTTIKVIASNYQGSAPVTATTNITPLNNLVLGSINCSTYLNVSWIAPTGASTGAQYSIQAITGNGSGTTLTYGSVVSFPGTATSSWSVTPTQTYKVIVTAFNTNGGWTQNSTTGIVCP